MTLPPAPRERPMLGVGMRCISATAFALMGLMLKLASLRGADVVELVFYRSAGAFVPVGIWVLLLGGASAIRTRNPLAHATRSGIGLASMVFTFGALTLLPLAQATTLTYSAPIGATILSALVLGEQVGMRRWAAVLVGFVGVLLVAHPFGESVPVFGLLVGVAASLLQAAVMVTLRQISGSEQTSAIVFWFTLSTGAASACLMPVFGHLHDPATMALLIGGGLLGGFGQIAMTSSLRFAPVSLVVPFDYLQILWATLFGWLVLASVPAPMMLIGAALITASGLYTAYRERQRGREPSQALSAPEA